MTLEEAIKHAEEVVAKNEKKASWFWGKEGNPNYENCVECAAEHRQLAEWLKDYKRLLEQEPRKGHWVLRNSFLVPYKCSECNYESERYDNFCPNCGAKMFKSQESEDNNG